MVAGLYNSWHLSKFPLHLCPCIQVAIYVTGFAKTLHVCATWRFFTNPVTYMLIATSRHNNKTGIDKQVCFYRWLVVNPVKSWRTIIDPVRPFRGINRVAWGPILSHCTSAQLMVWSGLLWPSVWPAVHSLVACVYWHHSTPYHLPTPLCVAFVILQATFKMSLKTTQSNQ